MQTLELNRMGLAPMSEVEMQKTEGGGKIQNLKKLGKKAWEYTDKFLSYIGAYEFFSDVAEGYKEGSKACNCK